MPREKMKQQQKILFVINPISGDIDKNGMKTQIVNYMSEHNEQVEFYETKGKDDKQELSSLIEKIIPEKVVAVGGDGTCNMVAQVLINTEIKMGIIPQGSANGLATELELPTEIHENLNIILKGKSRSIDVLQINNKYLSLHLSDIGFNAKVIERFEKGNSRGFWGYGKHFFKELWNMKSSKYKIEIDDKTIVKKAIMVVMANATKYGTGAVVNPKGKLDDGRFEIVIFRPQKFVQFVKMAIPFFTRQIHQLDFVDIYFGKKVIIKNYKHQKLQIDGEIMGQPEQIYVEIIPQSLSVLVP